MQEGLNQLQIDVLAVQQDLEFKNKNTMTMLEAVYPVDHRIFVSKLRDDWPNAVT